MSKSINKSKEETDLSKNFKKYIDLYLENLAKFPENIQPEFEVRFGTKKIKNINKVDFYNVIKSLLNYNFKLGSENYQLKIMNTGSQSHIRTQINGLPNIQTYCKLDNLSGILDETNLKFMEKEYFKLGDNTLSPIDFDDYNFRVSFQTEKYHNQSYSEVQELYDKWNSTKKVFRFIKRFEYSHPELPFLVHCSIVKTSKSVAGKFMPVFNIKDSNVFNNFENFEIEIEINNAAIIQKSSLLTSTFIHTNLSKIIKYVLIGIQETNYPITISEQNLITRDYLKLVKGQEYHDSHAVNLKDFVGPSLATLQMINLLPESDINDTNKSIPNIRKNYTVTDKADGIRKLMYIGNNGKIYLIPMNMIIQFTGCVTDQKEFFNTLIDGEHILHNKRGEFINNFASFDVYFVNGKNVTGLPFINTETGITEAETEPEQQAKTGKSAQEKEKEKEKSASKKQIEEKKTYRLVILNSIIKTIKPSSITGNKELPIKFSIKKFYGTNIFSGCSTILSNIESGLYEYNTDGLIFTPANTGVCSDKTGIAAPNYKTTWNESFKWKPPEYNTIDFLVKFKKDDYGVNMVGNIHNKGKDLTASTQVTNYYTIILHVGFDERKHGYINPCSDVINNYIKRNTNESYKNNYKPARFYPTNPSDENAGICNILGNLDESNNLKIFTEEGEEIEDNTIVEFKYDSTKPEFWRWIPLRVRYDKTSELRSGIKNFGNAYHVANSNWQSIHNPVSEKLIKSGEGVTIQTSDDDVYYNKVTNKSETRSLRDFHNLYIKSLLINKLSKIGHSLIDYAVGKGGDIPKWINSNLQFVLGIDLNKDNIENRLDGACARYLNYANKFTTIPRALFLNGNSSTNIRSGAAFHNEKNKQIIQALFGEGAKNEVLLGRGVYNNYGIAKNGFNISSIQFALHYMFENQETLKEFIKNLAQCTALEGYFIGTCYDGHKIFSMLNNSKKDESISIFKNEKKIWQITKSYNKQQFSDDETCLGYAIDIYQETINKTFREYLVNFKYLTRILENYGFVPLTLDEIKQLDLPGSIGNFEEMYNFMNDEVKRSKSLVHKIGTSLEMSEEEKRISFLNNYFIFKKVRTVNVDDIDGKQNQNQQSLHDESTQIQEQLDEIDEGVEDIQKQTIAEKSKKLAEKFASMQKLEGSQQQEPQESKQQKMDRIKLSVDEKIKAAEEKRKAREAQKLLEKEEKHKAKELKKSAKSKTQK
jgi:hypothetical protein